MIKHNAITIFFLFVSVIEVLAQPMSLHDCIRIATTENAQVKQAEVYANSAEEAKRMQAMHISHLYLSLIRTTFQQVACWIQLHTSSLQIAQYMI